MPFGYLSLPGPEGFHLYRCQKDGVYVVDARERHHKGIITSGGENHFKHRGSKSGGVSVRKTRRNRRMQRADGKRVESECLLISEADF